MSQHASSSFLSTHELYGHIHPHICRPYVHIRGTRYLARILISTTRTNTYRVEIYMSLQISILCAWYWWRAYPMITSSISRSANPIQRCIFFLLSTRNACFVWWYVIDAVIRKLIRATGILTLNKHTFLLAQCTHWLNSKIETHTENRHYQMTKRHPRSNGYLKRWNICGRTTNILDIVGILYRSLNIKKTYIASLLDDMCDSKDPRMRLRSGCAGHWLAIVWRILGITSDWKVVCKAASASNVPMVRIWVRATSSSNDDIFAQWKYLQSLLALTLKCERIEEQHVCEFATM